MSGAFRGHNLPLVKGGPYLRTILARILAGLLTLLLISTGSSQQSAFHLASILLFSFAVITTAIFEAGRNVKRPYIVAQATLLLVTAWACFQFIAVEGNWFANPSWSAAVDLFGQIPTSVSVAPSASAEALAAVALPFAVFLSAVTLLPNSRSAIAFLRLITALGIAVGLFGLVQFTLFPDWLLASRKTAYLDSVTTVFVNRNTAATFLGMILCCAISITVANLFDEAHDERFPAPSGRRWLHLYFFLIGSFIVFIALLLTKSRAGIASTTLAVAIIAMLRIFLGASVSGGDGGGVKCLVRKKAARAAAALATGFFLILLVWAFASQALLRWTYLGGGLDDLRFCIMPSLLKLATENWITGTGLGTFRYVFPPVRDINCGFEGLWVRAHNFYIEGVITFGLGFIVSLVAIVSSLFYYLWNGVRNRQRRRWIPILGIGICTLQLVHNAVDFSIQNIGVACVFAAIIGAVIVVSVAPQQRSSFGT